MVFCGVLGGGPLRRVGKRRQLSLFFVQMNVLFGEEGGIVLALNFEREDKSYDDSLCKKKSTKTLSPFGADEFGCQRDF